MALAIDNFQLTGELPAIPTAKHYIYAIDETGYDALGLYAWGDGELFGAWPGESWVDQKTIGDNVYKVFLLDAESGSYNLIFNNWNNGLQAPDFNITDNGQQVPDFNITANRDYYLRVTATGVTEIGGSAGIVETKNQPAVVSPFVYDLQGRKVGTADGRLPQGLYIVNGKKSIIR